MKKIRLILALTLIYSISIFAQQKLNLTVEDAINLGLQNSKSLHTSQLKVDVTNSKVKEANANRWFNIKFVGAYRRLSAITPFTLDMGPLGSYTIVPNILDNYTTQFTLTQPLFTGFKLLSNIDIADYNAQATAQDYNKDRSDLVYNIRVAYWNLYKANELLKVVNENVEQAKGHLRDANNLLKNGMLTNNDILKLEVQLSDIMLKQVDAENNVQLAMIGLNNILSIPLETVIDIASKVNLVSIEYKSLPELTKNAIEERTELKALENRISMGNAAVKMAASNWYPQIAFVADYYYSRPNQRIFPSQDVFTGTWDLGLNVSFNIWDWLTTARQTEQAQANLEQTIDSKQILRDAITLEVTQSYFNLNVAKQKVSISELAVKQATENNRITSEKFSSGLALSTDVVDAQTALLTADINYTNSIIDYELAKAKLDKSIGK